MCLREVDVRSDRSDMCLREAAVGGAGSPFRRAIGCQTVRSCCVSARWTLSVAVTHGSPWFLSYRGAGRHNLQALQGGSSPRCNRRRGAARRTAGAGVEHVKYAVMHGRAPTGLGCGDQWCKQRPLPIGEAGGVTVRRRSHQQAPCRTRDPVERRSLQPFQTPSSSVGQSRRLITARSQVRGLPAPQSQDKRAVGSSPATQQLGHSTCFHVPR
jgi:hypothetical protein